MPEGQGTETLESLEITYQSPKANTPPRRGHTGPERILLAELTTILSTYHTSPRCPKAVGLASPIAPFHSTDRLQVKESSTGAPVVLGGWLVHCSPKPARRTFTGNRPRLSSSGPVRRSHVCRLIPTRRHQVPPARRRSPRGHAGLQGRVVVAPRYPPRF
ncbi:hypothetical protein JTE90_002300 [Oedothorax gibbosus]|uniref:Uncharacterized protein n=1 Tax=Oedothorax gibbosus TaxID=931172 RepID=A0AAV6ULE6_9ARAC|nr:hypothetical protein JTE90_002300 [Oedothorax gibbosus]